MSTILLVDDEKNIRGALARSLKLEGFATLEAEHGLQALETLAHHEIDVMVLDLQMPLCDGMQTLEQMAQRGHAVPTIMLTAHGSIERAVAAVRAGAFDFVEKPPSIERLLVVISNALKVRALSDENRRLREESGRGGALLGDAPAMRALKQVIAQVAPTDATVLLSGENGAGKELAAQAIVAASPRRHQPYVTVNCAAIPETLFESELFGHAKGAFTGAQQAKRGRFQQAHKGTLLLDEIGEMPSAVQPKLLRVLESGQVERVGGEAAERVDVRVIAATNRDLEQEVAQGRFRQDLFFRLHVIPIRVPALRERREDLPLLIAHFLAIACRRHRLRPKQFEREALIALQRHSWPGNVRELRNTIERLAILSAESTIPLSAVETTLATAPRVAAEPNAVCAPFGPFDLAAQLSAFERELIEQVIERNAGNMSKSAEELNLERSHLYKKLKVLGIERT
jgi:DNA-binding NtrC family response regulator